MKVELIEHEGCFAFNMIAETMTEAAALVRFGMNQTKEVRHSYTTASQSGEFTTDIVFAKSKRADGCVPRRK